ncbi:SDR family NAD(P)-dependent oxidoreductase, partial [Nonomuraea sp. RK-328]|nr:SDR family NAD(P)-dependent oxidoreductase [Nonomuraea sp. RK-328]
MLGRRKVGDLFADRFTRAFDPAATPTFITNLCEVVPEIDSALLSGPAAPADAPEASPDGEPTGDPLLLLRRLVAEHAEFPLEAVQADSKFLDDLHLSSIVVGEIVGEAMRRLGLSEPAAPTGYATATLGQVAETLEQLVATGQAPAEDAETAAARIVPPGVAPWVHGFAVARRESGPPSRTAPRSPGAWRVVGGHPAAEGLRAALEEAEAGAGVLAVLPSGPDAERLAVLRAAADAVLADKDVTRCAIVQERPGGAGFAKTLHLEAPWVATTVVTLPLDEGAPARVAAEVTATGGFTEVFYDADGTRTEPVLTPVELGGGEVPLGPDDVLLVTGGGKGITAECALSLAKETGARLALLGRSDPARDAELAANLERMAATGVTARYLRADVTDPEAVAEAAAAVESDLGRITAVLYGAGGNVPKLLQELTGDDYAATIDPKVAGLEAVLAAVDTAALRLLVTFGSITGRAGLRGEAHYAIANEWQSDLVERLARELPHCRCRAVEWSLWSGVGMGERLGSVESLARVGVTTITPDQGVAMLRDLAADPDAPVVTVVTGRFGDLPTVTFAAGRDACDDLPLLRFLEQPRVHYPGIELVADSEVGWSSDPYLAEHVFGGGEGAVVPGTVGMEMMAQAAAGLVGADAVPVLENVEFLRAVVVPEDAPVTVRVAALRVGPGRVAAAVRTSATKFQVDHFRAVCAYSEAAGEPDPIGLVRRDDVALPPMAFDPATDLYGPMLFHGPRFKLVESIHRTGAQHVTGRLLPGTDASWFGRYLPDRLLLGDPAARDAYMQPMQTCGPTVLAIPLGVDRVVPGRHAGAQATDVYIRHRFDDKCWDIEVTDRDGRVVETWQGFRTQLVSKYEVPREWVPVLLGSYLEHVLIEQDLAGRVVLDVDGDGLERRQASLLAVRRLFGAGTEVVWRPDGRPEVVGGGTVSVSHAAGVTMATTTAGCDLETVTPRSEEAWTSLLGRERLALAGTVAEETGEDADTAATRVWTAAECLVKAGMPVDTAVTFDSAREGGWVGLVAGGRRILTLSTRLRGVAAPVVLAVLAETDPDAGKAGELR